MYFNINKTKRNFILYISALFDIGKLVKNMNINFDFSEKIKYLLDNYSSNEEIMPLLFAKIGEEGYNKLSDEEKLRLELL